MLAVGTMAYVGRDKCGCVVFCTVDEPDCKRYTAKEVGKAIRDGLTIERMGIEAVRALPFDHKCKAVQKSLASVEGASDV